ncbi:MAG: hypothetical protein QOH14_317, partial [Pseudonocardiales bacterium]|nr:hypothetical protein [Pseudonocardiales bacterium]
MSERNKIRRGGLGRGLGALIPTSPAIESDAPAPTDVYFTAGSATMTADAAPAAPQLDGAGADAFAPDG